MSKVTKAVIAAAGFGTRFLPQTKAMPKEMLPLIDKPIIQYVVEELVDAGIEDILIQVRSNKRTLEDHFDLPGHDLVNNLKAGGEKKKPLLDEIEAIAHLANFVYVRAKAPYGTAAPVMDVAHLLGDEPFIYTFADDFFVASPSRFRQMIHLHEARGGSVVSCLKATDDVQYERYGFVAGTEMEPGLIEVDSLVEKPGKAAAPSDLASVSSYLLEPQVIKYVAEAADTIPDGQEFLIQPALAAMLKDGHKLWALEIQNAKYYDTGDKLEYLKTVIDFGLAHEELGADLRAYMQERLDQ